MSNIDRFKLYAKNFNPDMMENDFYHKGFDDACCAKIHEPGLNWQKQDKSDYQDGFNDARK